MESDGPRTGEVKADDARRGNVVPFPRDWVRSQEELVPFGLDPAPGGFEAAPGGDPRAASDTGAVDRPVGASDFWDESSWAVQNPLAGPPVDEAASDDTSFDWEPDDRPHRGSPRASWLTRARAARPGQLAVIGAVVLALLGFVASRLGGSSPPRPEAKASSAAVRPHASAIRGARPRSAFLPSQPQRAAARHPAKRHHPSARHQPATAGPHGAGSTQVGQPTSESVAAQSGGQAQQSGGFSPPPSSGGGQSASHTATTTSHVHSPPPTGPSGRHALLGPGVCGGCK